MSSGEQETLRRTVVHAILRSGMSQSEAARVFEVRRQTINGWMKAWRDGGEAALASRLRGRRSEDQAKLKAHQAETIRKLIVGKCPEQLELPFCLWTREAVRDLIEKRFGIRLAIRTVGDYLKRWGYTPQKPLKRAYERRPALIDEWLETTYPGLRKRAKKEGGAIFWGDETGVRADYRTGRSFSPRGTKPVTRGTGKRFGCSVISAISNTGKMYFMVYETTCNSDLFIKFLRQLIRQSRGTKVFLVVDNLSVHRSRKVTAWVKQRRDEIELVFLPPYAPELNPDELLNHDLKANAVGMRRVRKKSELLANVRRHLRSRQRSPSVIRAFFREKHVAYAA